jgi:hypothetical protein
MGRGINTVNMELTLTTAGGKIACRRCNAMSKLGGVALKIAVLEEVGNIVQHKNRWRDSASRGIQACIETGIFDSNGDQLKFS